VVFFTNFGTAYVTRFNDVPASTGYGDPIQKLFKFDDNERVVGATSLDPRIGPSEKWLAISRKGFGLRFALAAHSELSTRAGRRFARPAEGDELIGVSPVSDKDLLAVVSEESHTLVCRAEEVNELAGPGRGVTVIKLEDDDKVIAYLATSDKQAVVPLETTKGKRLELTTFRQEPVTRGGRGWQMVKRDKVLRLATGPVVQALPVPEAGK
jgi:DNA gyrase subunit A